MSDVRTWETVHMEMHALYQTMADGETSEVEVEALEGWRHEHRVADLIDDYFFEVWFRERSDGPASLVQGVRCDPRAVRAWTAFWELDAATQEAALVLLPEWSGTIEELFSVAGSL